MCKEDPCAFFAALPSSEERSQRFLIPKRVKETNPYPSIIGG